MMQSTVSQRLKIFKRFCIEEAWLHWLCKLWTQTHRVINGVELNIKVSYLGNYDNIKLKKRATVTTYIRACNGAQNIGNVNLIVHESGHRVGWESRKWEGKEGGKSQGLWNQIIPHKINLASTEEAVPREAGLLYDSRRISVYETLKNFERMTS